MFDQNRLFEKHRSSILMASAEVYTASKRGGDAYPHNSRVHIVPQNVGNMSLEALKRVQEAEGRVNWAARTIGRLAHLYDDKEAGGLKGLVARVEIGITSLFERENTRFARESGLIDQVRKAE
jgi:hypothetical protein